VLELLRAGEQRRGDGRVVVEARMRRLASTRNAARSGGMNGIAYSTRSGHGTMVDFTVFIAIASFTACAMPDSVNG